MVDQSRAGVCLYPSFFLVARVDHVTLPPLAKYWPRPTQIPRARGRYGKKLDQKKYLPKTAKVPWGWVHNFFWFLDRKWRITFSRPKIDNIWYVVPHLYVNLCEFMKTVWKIMWIYVNLCEFVWFCVNLCEFMWTYVNLCEIIWIYMRLCEFMWIYVNLCEFMRIYVILCNFMWIYVHLCAFMWIYVNLCEFKCAWRGVLHFFHFFVNKSG